MDDKAEHKGNNWQCPRPCGLTKDMCILKHVNVDRDIHDLKEDARRAREEYIILVRESEARIKERFEEYEDRTLERIKHQGEVIKEITDNIKASYKEAVGKVVSGLNLHRKDIEKYREELDSLNSRMPSDAISRIVAVEDWKKSLPDVKTEIERNRDFRIKGLFLGTLAVIFLTLSFNWVIKLGGSVLKHLFGGVP